MLYYECKKAIKHISALKLTEKKIHIFGGLNDQTKNASRISAKILEAKRLLDDSVGNFLNLKVHNHHESSICR